MSTDRHATLRQLCSIGAIGAALVAERLVTARPADLSGWTLYAAAAILIAFVAGQPPAADAATQAVNERRVPMWLRLPCGAGSVAAVGAATMFSAWDRWPVATVLAWVLSFACGSVAVSGWRATPPARTALRWSGREAVVLSAILVIAAVARVSWPDALPPYYFQDEGRVGIFIREAFTDRIPNPFTMGWNTWPVIGLSVQGMFGPLLGLSIPTLRFSSAVMGTLGVLTTYLVARELFNGRVALLAAALLALSRTAIDFSRLGTCHAQVMVLAPLAFFFWWRAVNTGAALHYLWAGIGLGLCLYTYNAGQLIPVLWVGWVLLSTLFAPRRIISHWRGAALVLLGFTLAIFPYAFYFTDHFRFAENWGQWTIMARNRQTMDQVLALWRTSGVSAALQYASRQVWLTWQGFNILPAAAYGLGYRGGGMLDHVSAPLFFLGLALCLAQTRSPRHVFVAYWWMVTTIFGGVLTIDPPAVVRLVGLFPVLALFAAMPLDAVLRTADGTRRTAIARVAVAAALVAVAWSTWQTYFVDFARQPSDQVTEISRVLRRLPPDGVAFFVGSEYEDTGPPPRSQLHFNQEFFLVNFPGRRFRDIANPGSLLPVHEALPSSLTLILGPSQLTKVSYIRSIYPDVTVTDYQPPGNPLLFRVVHIPPEGLSARAGLERTVYDGTQLVEAARIADPFAADAATGAPGRQLRWSGTVYWPTDHAATLTLQSSAPATVQLANGAALHTPDGSPVRASVKLPRGWQPFTIEESSAAERRLVMSIERDGSVQPLTRWQMRPEAASGLTAVYEPAGQPAFQVIDPQLNDYATEGFFRPPNANIDPKLPFTASWDGGLRITRPGTYRFELRTSGPATLRLDGAPLFTETNVAPERARTSYTTCTLAAGLHALTAHWDAPQPKYNTAPRVFQLFWTPPDGERHLIPPPAFAPKAPTSAEQAPAATCTVAAASRR